MLSAVFGSSMFGYCSGEYRSRLPRAPKTRPLGPPLKPVMERSAFPVGLHCSVSGWPAPSGVVAVFLLKLDPGVLRTQKCGGDEAAPNYLISGSSAIGLAELEVA